MPGRRGGDEAAPGRAPDEGGPGRVETEGEPGLEGQRGQEGEWGSEGSHGMERNVDQLDPGTPVDPAEFGIPDSNARGVQQVADEFEVDIEMRQTNPDATMKLEEGGYPPKHCEIKTKTGGELDELLGLPPGHRGEAVYFEPQLPEGVNSFDELSPELQNRFNQRFEEFAVQGPKIQELEAGGLIKVEDGVIYNTGLNKTPDMQDLPFAGDHDVFRVTPRDGSELTTEMENAIVNRLSEYGNGGHGSHMSPDWNPQNALAQDARYSIANNHLPTGDGGGGEALIKFSSGQEPVNSFANSQDMSGLTQPPELRDIEFFDEAAGQWRR